MTINNLHRDYMEDMMYFYGKNGRVKKGAKSGSMGRLKDPTESLQKEYAKISPITKAWSTKTEFNDMVKKANSFKKVYNKKAMQLAKELLNR